MWPSTSKKNRYSPSLPLVGRDSILVRLMPRSASSTKQFGQAPVPVGCERHQRGPVGAGRLGQFAGATQQQEAGGGVGDIGHVGGQGRQRVVRGGDRCRHGRVELPPPPPRPRRPPWDVVAIGVAPGTCSPANRDLHQRVRKRLATVLMSAALVPAAPAR